MKKLITTSALLLTAYFLLPTFLHAQWSTGGTQFSFTNQDNYLMKCSSGSNGELFTTWISYDTTGKVRLDARDHFGNLLSGWPVGGILISDTVGDYWKTEIVTSEDNLPIVIWYGYSTVNTGNDHRHIFAQKFDIAGNPLWNGGNPVMVSEDTTLQHMNPTVISNGNGGAIIAWIQTDNSFSPSSNDLYVQHLDSTGNIHTGWPGAPVVLASQAAINESYVQLILSENKNNLYAKYSQGSVVVSLWMQNLDPNTGNFKPGFILNTPKLISPGTNIYQNGGRVPKLFTNAANEFIILWVEFRGPGELYMQRMDTIGTNLLATNGATVYTISGDDMTYFDCFMNDITNEIFYAFKINTGANDVIHANKCNMNGVSIWGSNTVTTSNADYYPKVIDDSHNGMYIVFKQTVSTNVFQFTRLNADGTVNSTTTINGTNIGSINNFDGFNPHLDFQITAGVPDLVHVVWNKRLGDNLYDVFGCNITSNGQVCTTSYVLGIGETALSNLIVYPNPADNIISINGLEENEYRYQVLDISGRVVAMGTLQPNENSIDISSLSTGIYILRVNEFYSRVIVE